MKKNLDTYYYYLRITANLIAQSRFKNKMILKGGSVLMSKLTECNREDLYRLTRDLDIHCDKREVWIDFYTNIEKILNTNTLGLVYKLIKRRSAEKGLDTSDSLKFSILDSNTGEVLEFKIDLNIKSNAIITCDYSPVLNMTTYDLLTMSSDKIVVVSSKQIYRRIKDLYDLAVIASLSDYKLSEVRHHLAVKHPNAKLENYLIPDNFEQLEHAYNRYDGIANKPHIGDLIAIDSSFLQPLYIGYGDELVWEHIRSMWMES